MAIQRSSSCNPNPGEPIIDLDEVLDKFPAVRPIKPLIRPLLGRTLRLDRFCNDVAAWDQACDREPPFEALLRLQGLSIRILNGEIAELTREGPLVVVSNHPFGILEALALGRLAEEGGRQAKIMGSEFLTRIAPMKPFLIPVDSFARRRASSGNTAPLREAARQLKAGGLVIIFPGGRVSHFRLSKLDVCDPPWTDHVARLVRISDAPVLPVHFHGLNSFAFYAFGLLHPAVRTLMLLRQLYRRIDGGGVIPLSIGKRLPASWVIDNKNGVCPTDRLREAVYALP